MGKPLLWPFEVRLLTENLIHKMYMIQLCAQQFSIKLSYFWPFHRGSFGYAFLWLTRYKVAFAIWFLVLASMHNVIFSEHISTSTFIKKDTFSALLLCFWNGNDVLETEKGERHCHILFSRKYVFDHSLSHFGHVFLFQWL